MAGPAPQLIETIRVEHDRHTPLLAGHWLRLRHSCAVLGYAWPGPVLVETLQRHIDSLDPRLDHRVRLLVGPDSQYEIASTVLDPIPEPLRLRLHPAALKAEAFWLRHKTTFRPWYAEAQQWLVENPDVFDVVFCNDKDEVCEGSRSNLYIRDGSGVWLTPPMDAGLLPGVQRQALLDGGQVREGRISRADLMAAGDIRVSNALRGWRAAAL
ncbi:MAG TPA: aminotransferase class IV [Candidimonas sp.]|nr:aminotransferase class IV [Candidimonas sp.]